MGKKSELSLQRFGRLLVLSEAGRDKYGAVLWNCKCDCGVETIKAGIHLVAGHTRSCGCFRDEFAGTHSITHGHKTSGAPSPTYRTWRSMLARCHGPQKDKYKYYGGSGVSVCTEWRTSFSNFLDDMGERPDGMTLDRKDGALGYSKDNCRWATLSEQAVNRRQYESKSGIKNVVWRKNRWVVVIKQKGRSDYFGSFTNLEDAAVAAAKGREKIYGAGGDGLR